MIDSLILNNKEQHIFIKLANKGLKKNNNVSTNFELLYRATRDGWTLDDITKKLSNKRRTIILIRSDTDNIFGGYVSISWSGSRDWYRDSKSFLMLIKSSKNYPPETFNIKYPVYPYVVYKKDYTHMITIGDYHIRIGQNCNEEDGSYTDAAKDKHSFEGEEVNLYGIPSAYYLNGDIKAFKVREIEAFLVSDGL